MAALKYLWCFNSIYFLGIYIPCTIHTSSCSCNHQGRFLITRDPGASVPVPPKINDPKPLKRWNITIRAIYIYDIRRTLLSVSSNRARLKYLWCFNSIYFLGMYIPGKDVILAAVVTITMYFQTREIQGLLCQSLIKLMI